MFISRRVTPSDFTSLTALVYVLSVVPKPGMVMAMMPFRSRLSLSKASTQTSSARVESRPPLTPMTMVSALVCSMRLASPSLCIHSISSQLSPSLSPRGTKGSGLTLRMRCRGAVSLPSLGISMCVNSRMFSRSAGMRSFDDAKVVFRSLSWRSISTSMSLTASCSFIWKRSPS